MTNRCPYCKRMRRYGHPEEFTPEKPAEEVLEWLRANRPGGGTVCLLHGDYRPKNLLWHENRLSSVIDWAFADIGDPYYDLSIFRWYLRDASEWQSFLGAYGMTAFDQERFTYCMALHKFLNASKRGAEHRRHCGIQPLLFRSALRSG